jgi:predicted MFS family arabinose efflux permease
MMTDIMKELPITYAQWRYAVTTVTVCTGICMFVGSVLIDKLGNTKVMIIALSLRMPRWVYRLFYPQLFFMLLGRIITGIGHGLSSGATPSIILERV